MTERDIERKLKRRLEESIPTAKCLKFVSPGFSGVPDRIVLLPGGLVVFVELKHPGKVELKRQKFVQAKLRRLGFTVYGSVNSPEKVTAVIQHCETLLRSRAEKAR